MQKISLTEDQCLAKNSTFKKELSKLVKDGYQIIYEYTHPAIGKVAILEKPIPKKDYFLDNFMEEAIQEIENDHYDEW